MHKSLFHFLLGATILFSCSSTKGHVSADGPNGLSTKEKNDGWVLLFDGKTTNGWHTYNTNGVSENWKVVDGTLMLDPKIKVSGGGGDLVTNDSYEDYEFVTDWRISEGGNSGIIFNIKEDPKYRNTYNTGPEMQILDNIKAEDNKKENHLAGLLYDMAGTAALSKPKPVGEWNNARIVQKAGHLTFYFNGVKTLDVQQGSEEWKAMIAASKFKDWKEFDTSPNGKIAFQNHGHEVAFRNVKIRKL